MNDRIEDRESIETEQVERGARSSLEASSSEKEVGVEGSQARSEALPSGKTMSAWRKAAVWLIAVTLLAFVGYRGALGHSVSNVVDASSLAKGAAPPSVPVATTGTLGEKAAGEMETRRAPPETTAPIGSAPPETTTAEAPERATPRPDDARAPADDRTGDPGAAGHTTPRAEPEGSQAITPDGKIILNLATDVELRRLPGIGKARARAILAERERLGRFRRIEDLLRVKGIGRKRLQAIRNKVVLDP